jgi:hypothetical protein
MDRTKTTRPRIAADFMDFVATPMFRLLADFLPQSSMLVDYININRQAWQKGLDDLTKDKDTEEKERKEQEEEEEEEEEESAARTGENGDGEEEGERETTTKTTSTSEEKREAPEKAEKAENPDKYKNPNKEVPKQDGYKKKNSEQT